jgi:hypothetical protein
VKFCGGTGGLVCANPGVTIIAAKANPKTMRMIISPSWREYIIERTVTAMGQQGLGRSKRFAE